ncbi:MAG TPA: glycosyltransferase [Patescibacteria group bacterium]
MKPIVSIIIVNYLLEQELLDCLSSIYKSQTKTPFEIIVVDNSEIKTIQKEVKKYFPKVVYIPNSNNGFGGGNNKGALKAQGKYLFFLNPDTLVKPKAIDILENFLENNHNAGIVAPLLTDLEDKPFALQGSNKLTPLNAIFSLSFINKLFPNNSISHKYWLKDWDKKNVKKISVVPGTAFMIKKSIFKQLHGFDEKFFLYFEESDLCKRVEKLGCEIYITPKARIFHAWGQSTNKSKKNIATIFNESKFYYFKKHYGVFAAWLVKLTTEFSKETAIFLLILLLGIFLRFFMLSQNFTFDGEIGDNHLDLVNAYTHHQIPLRGAPTSHPWLYFGPLFYWVYEPLLILNKFNPVTYALFGAVVSILIIIANYIIVKKLFSSSVALLSTYLITISPLFLFFGRISRFFCIVPLLVYPFLIMLKKLAKNEKKYLFWIWFLIGVMLNFHYTPLFLIPVVISVLIAQKIKINGKDIISSVIGFLIPFTPLLIYDSREHFTMTVNLILWIPYRILGFLGIYHKNTVTQAVLHENTSSILNFFSYLFTQTPQNGYTILGLIVFIITILFVLFNAYKAIRNHTVSSVWLMLFAWGFWGFLALFVHGDAPLHYYVPLFSFPIIILSLFFVTISKTNLGKIVVFIFLAFVTISNYFFFFSTQWLYRYKTDPYAYGLRQKAAQTIISDAHGKPFMLKRVGYYDDYAKNYSQNYIYLLWWYGNMPKDKAKVEYIIYEDMSKLPKKLTPKEKFFSVSQNIAIIREDL